MARRSTHGPTSWMPVATSAHTSPTTTAARYRRTYGSSRRSAVQVTPPVYVPPAHAARGRNQQGSIERGPATDTWARASQPRRIPMTRRLTLLLTLAASMVAGTAHAQFNRSDPATGETYAVEFAYGWWRPAPTIQIASEGLEIPPTL